MNIQDAYNPFSHQLATPPHLLQLARCATVAKWQLQADDHTMELAYCRNGNVKVVINYMHILRSMMYICTHMSIIKEIKCVQGKTVSLLAVYAAGASNNVAKTLWLYWRAVSNRWTGLWTGLLDWITGSNQSDDVRSKMWLHKIKADQAALVVCKAV